MEKVFYKRIMKALEEEEKLPGDLDFLDLLRKLASEDSRYFELAPEIRNAINAFFEEARDNLLKEIFVGTFGVQILLDTFLLLSFEVGYKLHQERGDLLGDPL